MFAPILIIIYTLLSILVLAFLLPKRKVTKIKEQMKLDKQDRFRKKMEYLNTHQKVEATITNFNFEGDFRGLVDFYTVNIEFTDQNSEPQRGSLGMAYNGNTPQIGDKIKIYYNPKNAKEIVSEDYFMKQILI